MGKYVYLEDKEIKVIEMALDSLTENTGEYNDYIDDIENKLSEKPKILEELGYHKSKDSISTKHIFITDIRGNDGLKSVNNHINIFPFNKLVYIDDVVDIEELEAILNKAKELFKEENK